MKVVPQSEPGILFTDLTKKVASKLSKADQAKVGSLMWYVTTVKLELEVRGELRRVRGVTPLRHNFLHLAVISRSEMTANQN